MKIFVSYRRRDSMAQAGRLSDRLAAHFGAGSVFRDLVDLGAPNNIREAVASEVSQCDVVLALIGPAWISATDASGSTSLSNPDDSIRYELETAFRLGLPVVPVLVDGASMPSPQQLPPFLQRLSQRNAFALPPDPDYSRAVSRLLEALESMSAQRQAAGAQPPPDLPNLAGKPRVVFISHATADRTWVEREIVTPLRAIGCSPWYSRESIDTSSQWEREILKGLEACDWFLIVASPRSATSEWIKDELNWAVYNRSTRIVPVIMEEADLWSFHIRLPRIQNVNFAREPMTARQRLLARFSGDV